MGKNKKVLVLSCSVRKGHYSDTLGDEFIRGAQASGYEAVKIRIGDHLQSKCSHCPEFASCITGHFSNRSYEAILKADIIVIASSIAIASPRGRFYRHTQEVCRHIYTLHEKNEREIRNKTVYLIVSSGEPYDEYNKIEMLGSFRKYIGYFENTHEGGHLFTFGVPRKDTAKNNLALQQAYEMGKNSDLFFSYVLSFNPKRGTYVNAKENDGHTPLQAADTEEKKRILREAGARSF